MNTERNIPDFYWEQLALGELEEPMKTQLLSMPEAKEKLKKLEEANQAFLQANSFADFNLALDRKLKSGDVEKTEKQKILPFGKIRVFLPLAAAAALAFALIIPQRLGFFIGDNTQETIILKGEADLRIYKDQQGGPLMLKEGSLVKKGDRLQLAYNGNGAAYGVIFSLDGSGALTMHYPEFGTESAELETGMVNLSFSYILDDAPIGERFFFLFSDESFDANSFMLNARLSEGDVSIPEDSGILYKTILLRKEE